LTIQRYGIVDYFWKISLDHADVWVVFLPSAKFYQILQKIDDVGPDINVIVFLERVRRDDEWRGKVVIRYPTVPGYTNGDLLPDLCASMRTRQPHPHYPRRDLRLLAY
jgi:hypothetical protein